MIGIIFAAGIGSRLKPFTDSHPKALAPLGGVPMITRVARKLLEAGATRLIVNVHHFPQQIIDEISRSPFAGLVEISDESDLLLDTGGALAKIALQSRVFASVESDEPIIVHNADIYTDFPIEEMVKRHTDTDADATILVDPRRNSSRHFLFSSDGQLHGWENSDKGITRPEGLSTDGLYAAAFGGVNILTPATIRSIAESGIRPFSIVDWYLNNCTTKSILGYTPSEPYRWYDIGTPEKLAAAETAIAEQE